MDGIHERDSRGNITHRKQIWKRVSGGCQSGPSEVTFLSDLKMNGIVRRPTDAQQVTDADEEVQPKRGLSNFASLTISVPLRFFCCTLGWQRLPQLRRNRVWATWTHAVQF